MWVGLGLILVAAAAVFAAWYFWMGDPVVTFDGENVSYRGSTKFDAGAVDFTLDSSYENEAAFILWRFKDPSMTDEEVHEYTENNPVSSVPEFVAEYSPRFVENDVLERRYTLSEGTWGITVGTARDDGNQGFYVLRILVE